MLLKTSAGNEYAVDWIDTVSTGGVYMQMVDARPLSVIAPEFEGLEWLERFDENQGDKRFDGYPVLGMVKRAAPEVVLIQLAKEG